MANKDKGNLSLIIGASRLGSFIAVNLAKNGNSVVVIDKNPHSKNKLGEDFAGSFTLGDATDISILRSAGVEKAKEVVVVTNSDDVNIYLSNLIFVMFNKTNIICRISDPTKQKLLMSKEIAIINPFEMSLDEYRKCRERK